MESDIKKGPVLAAEVEEVPRIVRWLEGTLRADKGAGFPLLFERSRKIVRLYEILNYSTC